MTTTWQAPPAIEVPRAAQGSAPARLAARGPRLPLLLDVAGWSLWVFAGLRLLQEMDRLAIGAYDEGILLTNAQLLRDGALPYRDFYTNYPPGVFALLAGLFALFGPSVAVERALGVAVRLAMGVWAARIAGQLLERRWCGLAAGLVTAWTLWLRTEPFAYLLAVHGALLAVTLWLGAQRRGTRTAHVVAGAALGAVGWFRHDLFALFAAALAAVAGACWLVRRRQGGVATIALRSWLPWLLLGAIGASALFWLPVLGSCGVRQVLDDLVFDQARYVLPARGLPMPPLLPLDHGSDLPLPLPTALCRPLSGAVLLSLLGPLLAGIAIVVLPRTGTPRLGALLALALALAVIPQLLGRTDLTHAVYTLPPALLLAAVLAQRLAAAPGPRAAWALLLVALCVWPMRIALPTRAVVPPQPLAGPERAAGRAMRAPAARQQVLQFVAEHSAPDEPVYFGLADHSAVDTNEVDLYFFAGRRGATRYLQFDPDIVDRAAVQRQMIDEIERAGVRVAVLSSLPPRRVRADGSTGADLLDRHLAERFEVVRTVAPYRLLLRRR